MIQYSRREHAVDVKIKHILLEVILYVIEVCGCFTHQNLQTNPNWKFIRKDTITFCMNSAVTVKWITKHALDLAY